MTENIELFLTITETSRITGFPKRSLMNKEPKEIKRVSVVRRGRRSDVIESCFPFEDVVKLRPKFTSLYRSDLLSLFCLSQRVSTSCLAFRIIEVVRLLDISKQAVHDKINLGAVEQFDLRRNFRDFDERLILASDLKLIKSEPLNIKERILELFMEKQ